MYATNQKQNQRRPGFTAGLCSPIGKSAFTETRVEFAKRHPHYYQEDGIVKQGYGEQRFDQRGALLFIDQKYKPAQNTKRYNALQRFYKTEWKKEDCAYHLE